MVFILILQWMFFFASLMITKVKIKEENNIRNCSTTLSLAQTFFAATFSVPDKYGSRF